jgi:hypothetical protein
VKIIGEKKGGQNKNEKSEKQEQMEEGTNYLGQKNRKKNKRNTGTPLSPDQWTFRFSLGRKKKGPDQCFKSPAKTF